LRLFSTDKVQSFETWWKRILFNFFPAYRRTGGRVRFISCDWKEMHISLKLGYGTRNYVNTVFGGSIYGSSDPVFMMQLICILGPDYVVWDKAATINFKKPITGKVKARFLITDDVLAEIISKVRTENKCVIDIPVNFVDDAGTIYAEINKTLYIADKRYYEQRQKNK
jgi:acyl-coenzyme A thioesterase PaaI-like protein